MQPIETKTNRISAKRQELLQRRESLIDQLCKAARSCEDQQARQRLDHIELTNEFISTLDGLSEPSPGKGGAGHRYVVSSMFLHDSYRKLTADLAEQFFFVTGTEVGDAMVLDQWAELTHEKRSVMGVTAEPRSTHSLLIKLEQFGHRLLGHFHSHPGRGADATNPSGLDTSFQGRLESAGHVAVMAIFSRDGFVRFIRLDQKLDVEIHGKGVEPHAPGVYRLTDID